MNQTDIGMNANKWVLSTCGLILLIVDIRRFYVIQVLHPVGNDNNCTLFTRWGRVGENGQQQKKVRTDVNKDACFERV